MKHNERITLGAWRNTPHGRDALCAAGENGRHVHYTPRKSVGIGCKTSRDRPSATFFEVLAYEMGKSVTEVQKLYDRGLLS